MNGESDLEYTGERMIPESVDAWTLWEHLYRYRFALQFVRGKRVVDVACGEGYGSAAMLRAGAAGVIGLDVSPETCIHARQKYGVDARPADAHCLPLADASVDTVVSFETIEHLSDPPRFLDECRRILAPGGKLVISTPNKSVYREHTPNNEFHTSELDESEFASLLASRFSLLRYYGQSADTACWWWPRSLATHNSPWRDVKGYWRTKQWLFGRRQAHDLAQARQDPVEWLLRPEPALAFLFNPFRVRKRVHYAGEQPVYIVAVGVK